MEEDGSREVAEQRKPESLCELGGVYVRLFGETPTRAERAQ